MNILLIGGSGSFINNLIIKLNKEGHRIYLLTGSRYKQAPYQKVFERYDFTYDCTCLDEIFKSIDPDLTLFMGAHDTNFRWQEEKDAVRFSASLMNILMAYSMNNVGRFIYLSSDEVYGYDYDRFITEESPTAPSTMRGMVIAQGEELCRSFRVNRGLDILTLRIDNIYNIPQERKDVNNICARMCLEALEKGTISVTHDHFMSFMYETDAVEFIYRFIQADSQKYSIYNLSVSEAISEQELAHMVKDAMGEEITIVHNEKLGQRRVLSNNRMYEEFKIPLSCDLETIIQRMAEHMKNHRNLFLTGEKDKLPWWKRLMNKAGWFIHALIPFVENLICFIPFFMINNRTADSAYFANLDLYLLYVLLFAIVYGQQQATFSAVLATAGYCFRQMYDRSGFELMLDSNTYIWIAQLFILGLTIGYMKDKLNVLKRESEEEQQFLSVQLSDIQDINNSNVRVKDALETQIVNQNDSIGKIYSITSTLDQYSAEEVLFYATEILVQLFGTRDVAIYTISNSEYARLFSATSQKARSMGNSMRYAEMGEFYETIMSRKVYINKTLDDKYPLMATAIFENDKIQTILCIWGIPWERMTLGQANQLTVVSALIQNAVLRANKYLKVLERERYKAGTRIMETEAFSALSHAFMTAEAKGLTDSTLLRVMNKTGNSLQAGQFLDAQLRESDYIGTLEDGELYILLSNTSKEHSLNVINRMAQLGINIEVVEEME